MKSTEEIQDEYAQSRGYDNFYCLVMVEPKSVDYLTSIVQRLYAANVLEELISKGDICCNNFYPTVLVEDIEKLKKEI